MTDSKSIRVLVRVRPRLPFEGDQPIYNNLIVQPDGRSESIRVLIPSKSIDLRKLGRDSGGGKQQQFVAHQFSYDGILPEKANQEDVYQASGIDSMIESVLSGYNGTVFAYGQTGSGKTYSMDGLEYEVQESKKKGRRTKRKHVVRMASPFDQGLVFRSIDRIFNRLEELKMESANLPDDDNANKVYSLRCSFLQIYQENVYDLLASMESRKTTKFGLRIRWKKREGFFVENLFKFECDTAAACKEYFIKGVSNRVVASHALNARSSRSHSIFTLYVSSAPKAHPEMEVVSKLHLVDLAGSERVRNTGATGKILRQSIAINRSLFVLRKCIKALSNINKKEAAVLAKGGGMAMSRKARNGLATLKRLVPYRDSVLTRLLKNSLGGNSITVMIACLGPRDAVCEENYNTLKYASLAKSISNRAVINADPRTQLIHKLQKEVKELRAQLNRSQKVMMLERDLSNNASSSSYKNLSSLDGKLVMMQNMQNSSSSNVNDVLVLENVDSAASEVGENLVESVRLIKELMYDNHALRQQMLSGEGLESCQTAMNIENENLNKENAELRNQLQFYKSIILSNKKNPSEVQLKQNDIMFGTDDDESESDEVDLSSLINGFGFQHYQILQPGQARPRELKGNYSRRSPSQSQSRSQSAGGKRMIKPASPAARRLSSRSKGGLAFKMRSPSRGKLASPKKATLSHRSSSNKHSTVRKPWGSSKAKSSSRSSSRSSTTRSRPQSKAKKAATSASASASVSASASPEAYSEATIPMVELAKLFEERSKI
mmetsp:Transcript_8289/g.15370  ORF Transcript_8289/g.15370 Transcript_8289/m.15370 type:complete len:777 (+) Transcript_8289:75-2405(+)